MSDIVPLRNGWSQRSSIWRFELLSRDHDKIGELEVDRDRPPGIENNVNRTIKRTLDDVYISPSDASGVNPLADRLRVVEDIAGDQEYERGVFIFTHIEREGTGRTWRRASLSDQLVLFDQPIPQGWGVAPGTQLDYAIQLRFEEIGIPDFEIEATSFAVRGSEWVVWPAGTSGIDVVYDLCGLAGFYSAYFNNGGRGIVRSVDDLEAVDPLYEYGIGSIHADSMTIVNDVLDKPNRYIVISNSADHPVDGYWDVPSTAPHSIQNRGRIIARTYDVQGVDDPEQAERIAKAKGQSDNTTYEWKDFTMVPDPRLDTFEIVAVEDEPVHVQRWSQPCRDGSMSMETRRIYREPVP